MELHHLRCFLAIVKEGGFNKATDQLEMSLPAVSYQIRQLEKNLGVLLFHRGPAGASPTEAGRVLAIHAKSVLESERRAYRAVKELSTSVGENQ
jgi:DNA-binding transcriptional LysR family regulator